MTIWLLVALAAFFAVYLVLFIVFSVKYIKDSNKMFRVVDSMLEEEIKKSKRSKKNG